jgi:hypothetical protein
MIRSASVFTNPTKFDPFTGVVTWTPGFTAGSVKGVEFGAGLAHLDQFGRVGFEPLELRFQALQVLVQLGGHRKGHDHAFPLRVLGLVRIVDADDAAGPPHGPFLL